MNSNDFSVDSLISQLAGAAEISARRNAAIELFKLKDRKSIPPLINALADHEDVAIFATLALVNMGRDIADTVIETGLSSGNERQRAYSIEILGELQCENSLEMIVELLRKDRSELVRNAAVEAIGHFNDERSNELLKSLLNDDDVSIVALAAIALNRKGINEGICDKLLSQLHRADPSNQGLLLWALVEICDGAQQKKISQLADQTDNPDMKNVLNEIIRGIRLK